MSFPIPDPPPAKKAAIEADAPLLVPLLERFPEIRIYTRTNEHFEEIKRVLASGNEDVPLAVVRVTSEDEIAATIRLCEETGLPLGVRSGGNDFGNRNYVEGAVVIDVRLLCSISIAEDRQSVVIGGGVTHGQLLQTLDREKLDTPVGWGASIGYAGWACGGGYGLEVGHRGLGVDQILGARVVIPGGQVIVAGPSSDDDAFWSLRGGGAGMFGVVSQLTVRVYPRPRILAGNVVFPMSGIKDVFGNFEKLYAESFPDNFSGEVFVLNPPQSGGIVNHFFCWHLQDDLSDLAAAEEYLERIKSCGVVLNETVKQSKTAIFWAHLSFQVLQVLIVRCSNTVRISLHNREPCVERAAVLLQYLLYSARFHHRVRRCLIQTHSSDKHLMYSAPYLSWRWGQGRCVRGIWKSCQSPTCWRMRELSLQ